MVSCTNAASSPPYPNQTATLRSSGPAIAISDNPGVLQCVCWGQKVALTKLMVNSPFKQSNVVLFRQSAWRHPLLFLIETLFHKPKT